VAKKATVWWRGLVALAAAPVVVLAIAGASYGSDDTKDAPPPPKVAVVDPLETSFLQP
jgi:hypothetical protein